MLAAFGGGGFAIRTVSLVDHSQNVTLAIRISRTGNFVKQKCHEIVTFAPLKRSRFRRSADLRSAVSPTSSRQAPEALARENLPGARRPEACDTADRRSALRCGRSVRMAVQEAVGFFQAVRQHQTFVGQQLYRRPLSHELAFVQDGDP